MSDLQSALQRQTMLRFPNVFVGETEGHDSPRPPDEFSPRQINLNSRRASFVTTDEPQPNTADSSSAFLAAQKRNSMSSFNRAAAQQRRVSLSIVEQIADSLHATMMSEVVAKHEAKNKLLAASNIKRPDARRTSFVPVPPVPELPSTSYLTGDSFLLSPRGVEPQAQQGRRPSLMHRQDEALHRAVVAQSHQRDERQASVVETNLKTAAAAARKTFLENQRRAQRWATWMSIVSLSSLQRCVDNAITHGRLVRKSRRLIVPKVFVALRRSLRRARLYLTSSKFLKPAPQALRNADKLLALYTDDHLAWFIDTLSPRYFFEQESIIFSGIEEDEMYVLISGSCDVMVGTKHVFTIAPGMTFGTVGMLTGEPRSARIVARTQNVFVWLGKRKDFESFSRGGPEAPQQFQAAMTAINEMRIKNIRNVYKSLLEPMFVLQRYSMSFAGISKDFILQLTTRGLPRIARAGDVLLFTPTALTPTTTPETRHLSIHAGLGNNPVNMKKRMCGFIFRGRVRVSIPASAIPTLSLLVRQGDPGAASATGMPQWEALPEAERLEAILRLLAEAMSSMIELPKQRPGFQMATTLTASSGYRHEEHANYISIGGALGVDGDGLSASTNEFVVAAKEFVLRHCSSSTSNTVSYPGNSAQQQQQQRTFVDSTHPGVVFVVVAEFNGPMLIGFPSAILPSDPMLVQPASLLRVDAPAGCDALVWEHQVIQETDMVEQLTIRQNCLNLRTPFLPEITSDHLTHLLFRGSLAFDFLSKLQHHSDNVAVDEKHHQRHASKKLHVAPALIGTPWVFPAHQTISFCEETSWEFFIVLRGSLTVDAEFGASSVGNNTGKHYHAPPPGVVLTTKPSMDSSEHVPFIWPDTHFVFFGCTPMSATTGSVPVDALRVSRGDFIAWLLCGLTAGNLKTFVPAITEAFVGKTGRRPIWPGDGVHDSIIWSRATSESGEQQNVSRLLRLRQQLKVMVGSSLAQHTLTQLHPGASLMAQIFQQRKAEGKLQGQAMSPIITGEGSMSAFPSASRLSPTSRSHAMWGGGARTSPYRGDLPSKAMTRIVDEYEQRQAQARVAHSQWKRATSGGRERSHDATQWLPDVDQQQAVCSRHHPLGRVSPREQDELVSPASHRLPPSQTTPPRGEDHNVVITRGRLDELVQLRWDDDHHRNTHGVPATYQHWRDTTFTSIPISPTSVVSESTASTARSFPRPPTAATTSRSVVPVHRLTRQAEALARQLDALPRPGGSASRVGSARSSSSGGPRRSVVYDPESLRKKLLKEIRNDS